MTESVTKPQKHQTSDKRISSEMNGWKMKCPFEMAPLLRDMLIFRGVYDLMCSSFALAFLVHTKNCQNFPMPTKWSRDCCFTLQPGKLTWNTTMEVGNVFFLFNWVTFRFHVHFRKAILLGHVKNTSRPTKPNNPSFFLLFKPIKSFDAGPRPRTSGPGHVAEMRPESSNLGGVNLNKDYPCAVRSQIGSSLQGENQK